LEGIVLFKKSLLMLVSVLLVSVIAFSAFTPAFASDGVGDGETDVPKVVGIEFPPWEVKELDRNWYYLSLFQGLIECFPTVLVEGKYGLMEEIVYPSDYAGAYIDDDDNLHILLTKDAGTDSEYVYRALLRYDEDVVFERVDYSWSFLTDVQNALYCVMADFGIGSIGVRVQTNQLEVGFINREMESATMEFLKTKFEGFDECHVVFEDAVLATPMAANTINNALAGSKATYVANGYGTVGFNAIKSTVFGMVTAGHVATPNTVLFNEKGGPIGAAVSDTVLDGIDAAFVPFQNQSRMELSYRLVDNSSVSNDILTNYCPNGYYLAGQNTHKIGARTGYTTGKVDGINKVVTTTDNHVLTNQITVTNVCDVGDSGAAVYSAFGVSQATLVPPKTILGIATYGSGSYNYVSPVWTIMNTFGITPYLYPLQYTYVMGVGTSTDYGGGRVDNPSYLKGRFPDGESARILGIWTYGDGGNIVGYLPGAAKGTVAIFAQSITPSTKIYVYTSPTGLANTWTEITSSNGSGKWVYKNVNDEMAWVVCGSRNVNFEYIAIAAIYENNQPANIYIDTVIVY
jgi:hypothetical protein